MSFRFRRNGSWVIVFATMLVFAAMTPGVASADPTTEDVYVDGQTYQINTGAAVIFDASQGLLDQASPIYILGFPVAPGTTGPITLPSGYQPQHNGFPPSPVPYHDHVLAAVPGEADYGAPLRVVQLQYTTAYAYSTDFVPVTSYDELVAGEAAGIFQVINPGASNPYEIWTTTVLIRPVISQNS
ncbi:MAG: hypothetical protein ABWY65_09215 [Thermoleophilaceae bacterium]